MLLEVDGLTKAFGADRVLDGVSFMVEARRTLAILGRSGCGKTTLLKAIAGLHPIAAGRIVIGGREVTHLPPQDRGVVYLYQEPLLFPHLSVFENIAFGLHIRKVASDVIDRRVAQMVASLELDGHAEKMPDRLSGGQRQRVAFGRALVVNPSVLLLDEPFSNLDAETRTSMQELFKRVAADLGITALFVTHSLKEALVMGDALALLEDRRLHTFTSKRAFITAPETGVGQELQFWQSLGQDGR